MQDTIKPDTIQVEDLEKDLSRYKPVSVKSKAISSLIDGDAYYDKPPSICSINGVTYGTLGNISMWTGKPKSKKTMGLALLVAAVLGSEEIPGFHSTIETLRAAYFDTEQSNYHAGLHAKRINSLLDDNCNKNPYDYYALRKFSPKERIEIIEWVLYNTPQLKLAVIDGIADLLNKGVNDEEEAISIVSNLMKWSEELNVHIIVVLHQNKSDSNPKGHIGSQLNQKCETVLSVERDQENKGISKIEPTQSRGLDIEPIYITVNEKGIPEIISTQNAVQKIERKSKDPHDYNFDFHKRLLTDVFDSKPPFKYKELQEKIRHYLGKMSISIGERKSRDWITYFREEKLIGQKGQEYELL